MWPLWDSVVGTAFWAAVFVAVWRWRRGHHLGNPFQVWKQIYLRAFRPPEQHQPSTHQ